MNAVYPGLSLADTARRPAGYWNNLDNQRRFFDDLAKQLKIQHPQDWYNITIETVLNSGGGFVNRYYSGSLTRGICFICL